MAEPDLKKFTSPLVCEHCSNKSRLLIVGAYDDIRDRGGAEGGEYWELLYCESCEKCSLRSGFWNEMMEPDEFIWDIIYPKVADGLIGLPESVNKAYAAANKVRRVDANAYAVLLGRVLEIVCKDKKAKGNNLAAMLDDMAVRDLIPATLAEIAHKIRAFRNIGAHAASVDLSQTEAPLLNDLCSAVLQYVYVAPNMLKRAKGRLKKINPRRVTRKKSGTPIRKRAAT